MQALESPLRDPAVLPRDAPRFRRDRAPPAARPCAASSDSGAESSRRSHSRTSWRPCCLRRSEGTRHRRRSRRRPSPRARTRSRAPSATSRTGRPVRRNPLPGLQGTRCRDSGDARRRHGDGGPVLSQNGRVIAAPFHAVCGGRTARPRDVWDDEETPDLEPVDDDACLSAPGAAWTFFLARRDVPPLAATVGFPEGRLLEVFGHDASRRVSMVRFAAPGVASRVVRGFEFRKAASALWGWSSVRSTDFEVEESRAAYLLRGRGTGHGAGLCQAGAIVRARRGESRAAILGLYYRGAAVVRLSWSRTRGRR